MLRRNPKLVNDTDPLLGSRGTRRVATNGGTGANVLLQSFTLLGVVAAVILGVLGTIAFSSTNPGGSFQNDMITTNTLKSDTVCTTELKHVENGEIPASHSFQTLEGASAIAPTAAPPPVAPPVPFPLDGATPQSLTATPLPIPGTPFTVSAGVGPSSLVDDNGNIFLQLGSFNVFAPSFSCSSDSVPIGDNEFGEAMFALVQSELPLGASGVLVTARLLVSSEETYDFGFATKNGATIVSLDGVGPSSSDPFIETSLSVSLFPGDTLGLRFVKDQLCWGGVDAIRLQILDLEYITFEPVPAPPIGRVMTFPADLTAYVGKDIKICALDDNEHQIVAPVAKGFDIQSQYPVITLKGDGCCANFAVTSSGRVTADVDSSSCAAYCQQGVSGCTSRINARSIAHKAFVLTQNAQLPPAESLISIEADTPTLLEIQCSSLSEYVGKEYTVVSATPHAHQISINGGPLCKANFQVGDPTQGRTLAPVLRFEAEVGAYVKFTIVKDELLIVTANQFVRRCNFRGECAGVDQLVNLFEGYWQSIERGAFYPATENTVGAGLIKIEATSVFTGNNALQMTLYNGPPTQYHEASLGKTTVYQATEFKISSSPPVGTLAVGNGGWIDPSDLTLLNFQQFAIGEVSDDLLEQTAFESYITPVTYYRRISALPVDRGTTNKVENNDIDGLHHPSILGTGLNRYFNGRGFRDRRFMFDYYVDSALYLFNGAAMNERPVKCEHIRGYEFGIDLRDKLMTTGTTHTSNIILVQKTASARLLTTIRTDVAPHVNHASVVTIAGFTGPWAVLNGDHRVSNNANTVPEYIPELVDFGPDPNSRSVHFEFEIDFDSSMLPANSTTGYGDFTGTPTAFVKHGPVTGGMEYKPFMDAVFEWEAETFVAGEHHFSQYYANTVGNDLNRICLFMHDTWDALQSDITDNTNGLHPRTLSYAQRKHSPSASYLHVGRFRSTSNNGLQGGSDVALACIMNSQLTSAGRPARQNDPVGTPYTATYDQVNTVQKLLNLDFNIPFENYVTNKRYLTYRLAGGPPGFDPLFSQFFSSLYYPPFDMSVGEYLEGNTVPWDELPPVNDNVWTSINLNQVNGPCQDPFEFAFPTPRCNETGDCLDGFCDSYYEYLRDTNPILWESMRLNTWFGRINTSFTNGVNIGYVRWDNTNQGDALAYFIDSALAPPGTGLGSNNPRSRVEAGISITSALYDYMFNELGCEHVIMDIRGNSGGNTQTVLNHAQFWGAERELFNVGRITPGDEGFLERTLLTDLFDGFDGLNKVNGVDNARARPELSAMFYPGLVPNVGDPWILDDWRAISGGELFVNAFEGDTTGNLGAGVNAHLVGDAYGGIWGCNSADGNPILQDTNSAVLFAADGVTPLSPITISHDAFCHTLVHPNAQKTPICKMVDFNYPESLPGLSGLAGNNPPPNDYEHLWWHEIGHVPNPRPRLSGDTRPQTPITADRSTWRDHWLEALVEKILGTYTPRRRDAKAKTPDARFTERVEHWRQHMEQRKRTSPSIQPFRNCTAEDIEHHGPMVRTVVGKALQSQRQLRADTQSEAMLGFSMEVTMPGTNETRTGSSIDLLPIAKASASVIFKAEYAKGAFCRDTETNKIRITTKCEQMPIILV